MAFALIFALALSFLPMSAFAAPAETGHSGYDGYTDGTWYRVRSGDTLGEIARYFGTTVSAIKKVNGLSSSTIYVGQHLRIPHARPAHSCKSYYWVESGDNLSQIARWYGINTYALADANGLSNASLIYTGQKLCIPNIWATGGSYHSGGHPDGGHHGGGGGCYYTVQTGDNLSEIASWYGTTVHHLASVNHISNPRVIIPGQRLYVCG
jgi:LysM repeat protein